MLPLDTFSEPDVCQNAFAAGTLPPTPLGEHTRRAVAALQQGIQGWKAVVLDGRTFSYKQNEHFVHFRTLAFSFSLLSVRLPATTHFIRRVSVAAGETYTTPQTSPCSHSLSLRAFSALTLLVGFFDP